MGSLRWQVSGVLSLFFLLVAIGCGSSSSGSGAGGSLGSGGARDAAPGHGGAGTGGATGVGSGGVVGAGGGGGSGGAVDAGRDVAVVQLDAAVDSPAQPVDTGSPILDAAVDAPAGIDGGATLAQIKSLIAARCAGCHTGTGGAATRINFTDNSPDAGSTLYDRLLGPLVLETYCGENVDAGGDAAARRAIVPGDLASSFLYLKITGTQPSPGSPPANCGVRMPRVLVAGVDGGAPTQPSCDSLDGGAAANCLGVADINLVRQWILEGAPQ
ncbi:MAG TPA: hypothetical protein VF550_19690 [Polyangia bacterium]